MIDFKINQDFIAEFLCINKDEPESTCHGKCQLTKQLSDVDINNRKETPISLKLKIETRLFLQIDNPESKIDQFDKMEAVFYNPEMYVSTNLKSIFRPPQSHCIS